MGSRTLDGSGRLQPTKSRAPTDAAGGDRASGNRVGLRHLCFAVDDLASTVERLGNKGDGLAGMAERGPCSAVR